MGWTFWLATTLASFLLTAIPVLGLLGLALAVAFKPEELMLVLKTIIGEDGDAGSESVDPVPVVI